MASSHGRIVWVVILIVGFFVGKAMYDSYMVKRRATGLVLELHDTIEGSVVRDAHGLEESSARALAKLLPQAPHFFRDFCRTIPQRGHPERVDATLALIIRNLPDGVYLPPLLEIPRKHEHSFRNAVALVAGRATTQWLLERSCEDDEDVRALAAHALRRAMPDGKSNEDDIAELAADVSVAEKRAAYDRIRARVDAATKQE